MFVVNLKYVIMNRRVVLKSSLFVVLLGVVLVFSSCNKEESKIIGKWEYKKIEVRELETSNLAANSWIRTNIPTMFPTIMPMVLGSDFNGITEFTKNGKVKNGEYTATYKMNGAELTITADGGKSVIYGCSIPDEKNLHLDVNIIEMHNEAFNTMMDEALKSIELDITTLVIRLYFKKQ